MGLFNRSQNTSNSTSVYWRNFSNQAACQPGTVKQIKRVPVKVHAREAALQVLLSRLALCYMPPSSVVSAAGECLATQTPTECHRLSGGMLGKLKIHTS